MGGGVPSGGVTIVEISGQRSLKPIAWLRKLSEGELTDNTELEQQWGISYPMLVSLSRAREQYKQGLPFKADFDEFIRGLLFYSEMLFDYQGETYEAYLYRNKNVEPYKFVFCCAEFQQDFFSEKDFREKANINGNLLKDIWDEVQDPRYM